MKSTVNQAPVAAGRDYPTLKISNEGRVVLFKGPGSGVCLHSPLADDEIGKFSNDWAEAACFKPFVGTVTIEA